MYTFNTLNLVAKTNIPIVISTILAKCVKSQNENSQTIITV